MSYKSIFNVVGLAVMAMALYVGCANDEDPEGIFTDDRDGKSYAMVKIGTQTWMAENLNRATPGSSCYDNTSSNCDTYGRLYYWNEALTACPSGWHLPSDAAWTQLENYVGGSSTAGRNLKSTSGWNYYGNGTDAYGFSALPGGTRHSAGSFNNDVGNEGFWWSATENGTSA